MSSVSSISSSTSALAGVEPSTPSVRSGPARPGQPSKDEIKKAAGQFEAIIIRQLLAPAIEPAMKGLGGEGGGGGGGVYGYMLTDALANSLSQGQGMGLANMLEKQFTASPAAPTVSSSTALKLHSNSIPTS